MVGLLASVRQTAAPRAIRAVIHGPPGVGKTTIGAGAPGVVFAQTEDGAGLLNVPTFGPIKSFLHLMDCISELYTEAHDYRTLVIDSLDWLEPLVWSETCERNGLTSIEDASYGKGYLAADIVWRELMDGLNALHADKGMSILLLAHSEVRRFESPVTQAYDRYGIKLHKRGAAIALENVDAVFFLNYRISVVLDKSSGAKDGKTRGVGTGLRVLHTQERPGFVAKNRYALPATIDIPDDPNPSRAWSALAAHLPFLNNTKEQVKNGQFSRL